LQMWIIQQNKKLVVSRETFNLHEMTLTKRRFDFGFYDLWKKLLHIVKSLVFPEVFEYQ